MENPWKTLKSKNIYQNPWIEVEENKVLNPSGKEGIYGTVKFKNWAIAIVPVDRALNTWIVGQYRYPLDEYSWEVPMGGGKKDMPLLESAKRELREETGLTADSWTEVLKMHTSNSVTNEVGYTFLAEDLEEGNPEFDETEDLVIRKLPFRTVYEMVMDGEITDSLSMASILKIAILKNLV
jgi:8-oxo-dGTP pyrophosphatase MutT (NUDIX family)